MNWTVLGINLALCAAAVLLYFAAVMALSLGIRNHSLVDIFWGPGFVLVAAISYLASAALEKNMRRSRGAAYDDYVARTSGFLPRPPRKP